MALAGRCCFEMVDYPAAARAYEAMRALDPLRVDVGAAALLVRIPMRVPRC